MLPRQDLPSAAMRAIAAQAGVVSRGQLRCAGLTKNSIARLTRPWLSLGRGLWCTHEPTWRSALWAGLIHGGHGAAVGGLAAAHLEGWLIDPPHSATVWTDTQARPLRVSEWEVRFRRGERRGRGELSRTVPESTLLDAANETAADTAIHLLARAFSSSRTTPSRVLAAMGGRTRQRHRTLLEGACSHGMEGIESILEWRYATEVVAAHGLPEPARQVWLTAGTRSDNVYEEFGVIVEVDGHLGHDQPFRDRRRDNRHAILHGTITLRYGWHEITTDPCAVAEDLGRVLRPRGWDGQVARCRRCRRVPRR